MKVFKPLQTSLLYKTFELKGRHRLAVTVLFGFPFDGNEPLLEPDLWKFIAAEIGKNGILDLGMPKPNGEVLVYGSYYAPDGNPVQADRVRLHIGKVDKALLIYGNRYWRALLGSSEPEPFRVMPLDYAHAFGGKGFAKNPIGKGMVDVDVFGEMRRPLPNIEHPDRVMTSSGERPDPAGFGPLELTWEFRASKLGTYDEKWIMERAPAYPDDLNWNHFNAAPPDQWLEAFFGGNESFQLVNMHPDKPVINGQLPGFRTRCFVARASPADRQIDEIAMRAETVWLFPHVDTGVLLYRGVIDIQTDDASDVQNVIIGYEKLSDAPRDASHYADALASRLEGKYQMNTTDLIPIGARCALGALPDPEPETAPDSANDSKPKEESRREALIALSDKLTGVPGAETAKAKVDEAIIATYLPPFYPRPPGHERINELMEEKQRLEKLRDDIRKYGGDESMVLVPPLDIDGTRASLEEAGRQMKEGYRVQAHLMEEGRSLHEQHLKMLRLVLFERLARKENISGWDLADLDLSNEDLSDVDFSSCYLEGVKLTGSNLAGANLEGAILAFANLSRCNLSGANLKRANLGAANLTEAVFDGADMTGAILGKSILSGARLANCNLIDVDLGEAELGDADLSGSVLPNAQFTDLHMARTNFRTADLTGSTFTHCNLEESDFSEATLEESAWIESWLDGADFSVASMTNVRFVGGCSLRGARFVRTALDGANFRDADLRNADFTEASINTCDFGGCNAQQARFTRAIAQRTQFIGADLGEADLMSVDLREGTLMKARLTSATLRNANCYAVEFMNATVGGTDFSGAILYQTKLEHWRPGR